MNLQGKCRRLGVFLAQRRHLQATTLLKRCEEFSIKSIIYAVSRWHDPPGVDVVGTSWRVEVIIDTLLIG